MVTPSGSCGLSSSNFRRTPSTTSRALAPRSPRTSPCTASPMPSLVTEPYRVNAPMRTVATSPTRTTPPSRDMTTIERRSSSEVTLPSVRTRRASPPSETRPAPSFLLFASNAFFSVSAVMPCAPIAVEFGTTSKLRTSPPSALTSATPGSVRNAGRIVQSSKLRRSIRERPPPSIVNMNISPSGVVMGASPPDTLDGNSFVMLLKRSAT